MIIIIIIKIKNNNKKNDTNKNDGDGDGDGDDDDDDDMVVGRDYLPEASPGNEPRSPARRFHDYRSRGCFTTSNSHQPRTNLPPLSYSAAYVQGIWYVVWQKNKDNWRVYKIRELRLRNSRGRETV